MPCIPFRSEDGKVSGFICTRGRRRKRCATTGCEQWAEFECDYPLRGSKAGKSCNRPMCKACRTRVSRNKDYCPAHAARDTWDHSVMFDILDKEGGIVLTKPRNHPMLDEARRAGFEVRPTGTSLYEKEMWEAD